MNAPISPIQVEEVAKLIGKNILCANAIEGLGYYGILIGIDPKSGKFVVRRPNDKGLTFWNWVVKE